MPAPSLAIQPRGPHVHPLARRAAFVTDHLTPVILQVVAVRRPAAVQAGQSLGGEASDDGGEGTMGRGDNL